MKKVIVISGVGKGFGRELIRALVGEYYVVGLSRSRTDLVSLKEELTKISDSFGLIEVDLADFKETSELVRNYLDNLHGEIHGLINNAGVRCRGAIEDLTIEEIVAVSQTNLFGAVNLSKVLIPYFFEANAGRIVNISSIASAQGLKHLSGYAISKGGLDAFTRTMAVELGSRNILVNSILPGFSKTSMGANVSRNKALYEMTIRNIPVARWGEADELVGICRFLLSEDARYITGTSIPVDGGWLA